MTFNLSIFEDIFYSKTSCVHFLLSIGELFKYTTDGGNNTGLNTICATNSLKAEVSILPHSDMYIGSFYVLYTKAADHYT